VFYRHYCVCLYLTDDANLQPGDSLLLVSAKNKALYNNVAWEFDVRYPQRFTFEVKQREAEDGTLTVVAFVTSAEYGGQGSTGYDDEDDDPGSSTDDGEFNLEEEKVDATPLRAYCDDTERYIGSCLSAWRMSITNPNTAKMKLFTSEFNMLVPENEMKMDATEPSRNSFSYGNADQMIKIAQENNMYVRGHTLCWHSQVPSWISKDGYANDKGWSREELLSILKNHIENVAGHFKGQINEWDVCNEVLDDNQQTVWSNPNGYDLRQSIWQTVIGEDYLDSAFVWTHRVDPDAKLFLNDYGVEGQGWGKSEALVNLAKRLRNSGIPIDGIGLQGHMEASLDYYNAIEKNVACCGELGFLCHITELDLGVDNATTYNLEVQGLAYYKLARIAMKYGNCQSLMIWGLSDDMTWREGKNPLLFTSNLEKKPAYWGIHAALRQAAGAEINAIEQIGVEEEISPAPVFDLTGRRVEKLESGKMYISKGKILLVQ